MNLRSTLYKLKKYGITTFVFFVVKELYYHAHSIARKSYSQKKEDLIIDALLKNKKKGFYIDIGANDHKRFSNTKRFYDRGWNGINVEPHSKKYKLLLKYRPRDINLNLGISNKVGTLVFYSFEPDTLSTFSEEEANQYIASGYKLVEKLTVPVETLEKALHQYLNDEQVIDFISIDTEGHDFNVLLSNNWKKYRPRIICIESVKHISPQSSLNENKYSDYLNKYGYKKVYENGLNAIYQLSDN